MKTCRLVGRSRKRDIPISSVQVNGMVPWMTIFYKYSSGRPLRGNVISLPLAVVSRRIPNVYLALIPLPNVVSESFLYEESFGGLFSIILSSYRGRRPQPYTQSNLLSDCQITWSMDRIHKVIYPEI